MASPDIKNGYTSIANELLDALILFDLTKRQYKVLLAIIRKTYGWNRKTDDISSSQIAEMTGLTSTHCRATTRELSAIGIIEVNKGRYGQMITLVKDYETWGGLKQARPKTGRKQAQNGPAGRPETGRAVGPKQAGGEAQNGPYKIQLPKDTTQKPLPKDASGCGGDELIYPKGLNQSEKDQARTLVQTCNGHAQDVLDELTGLMQAQKIKVSTIGCLRSLVKAERSGEFTLEYGAQVQKARQRPRHKSLPEQSTNDVLAEHAKLTGMSVESHMKRIGIGMESKK